MNNAERNFKEEPFIDSDQKIIVSCPDCGNQNAIYLITSNRLTEGLQPQWCDCCNKPYIVEVESELKTKIKTWGSK